MAEIAPVGQAASNRALAAITRDGVAAHRAQRARLSAVRARTCVDREHGGGYANVTSTVTQDLTVQPSMPMDLYSANCRTPVRRHHQQDRFLAPVAAVRTAIGYL
jgi:hypothetical protein